MHKLKLIPAILTLFEGGEGGAGTGATAPAAGEQATGDLSKVVYGKQESAPAPEQAEDTTVQTAAESAQETVDREAQFRQMIQGDYKDLYNAEVQRIVKGRLKDMDTLRQQNQSQQEIIDRLSAKYGVTDLTQLAQAIDSDHAMWEEEADKAGMTTEQYMELQNLQRENAKLIRAEKERADAYQRQQTINAWMQEAEAVKQQYPAFDLEQEMQNPRFGAMLHSGVPMLDAFHAMHFAEIQNYTAQSAAQQAEAAVAANVRANGSRPVENGTRQQSSFTVKSDVHKLTKADRAEIAQRVRRGEKISF